MACNHVNLQALRRFAVEGNIAAGKSTFLESLRKFYPEAVLVSEPINKWQSISSDKEDMSKPTEHYSSNLLDMFYKDPKRWAYTFQTYACISRLRAQLRPLSPDLITSENSVQFFERSVYSDKFCFARNCYISGLFTKTEWDVYCDWHKFLMDTLPLHFDGFIYLRASPKICYDRLQKRKRAEESTVTRDYLEALHERHDEWLVRNEVAIPNAPPVLVLNCDQEFHDDEQVGKEMVEKVKEFVMNSRKTQ
ncbi:deoxycytidine kinase 2-like [Dysidea avara]|uniref:deoxycytidine kinase 2-like n=1 Tax=Dysidea avara TaxID=196820 RepID=UPI0033267FE1